MASEGSNEAAVAQPAENDQKENNLVRNAGTVGQDAWGAASPGGAATDGVVEFDEESALRNLTENVRDQDELERDITYQANLALIEAEDKKDKKRIEKAEANKVKLESQKKTQQQKLRGALGNPSLKLRIQQEISRIDSEIELVENDIVDFNTRIEQRHADEGEHEVTSGGNKKLPNETQREFLIRTGKITPFAKFGGPRPEGVEGGLANAVIDAEDEAVAQELEEEQGNDQPRSHQNLRLPGFTEEADYPISAVESEFSLRRRKKRKVQVEPASSDDFNPSGASDAPSPSSSVSAGSTVLSDDDLDRKRRRKKPAKAEASAEEKVDFSRIDDGDESLYQQRLWDWVDRRKRARQRRQQRLGEQVTDDAEEEEWFEPSPDQPDHYFDNGLKLPGDIYPSLFDYQKTGVQWLAELYAQRVGGIVGDEMGLGKTVQMISFLAALHYSKKLTKPVIVVAPATVLRQWVNEFHRWWPPLRVSILHSSGSGMLNVRSEGRIEDVDYSWDQREKQSKSSKAAKKIVNRVVKHGHVLVTTYAGLQTYGDILIPVDWDYAVLDEGHKIRNPNTAITIYCKELRTANRVILSGTPMQNNLTELWSLFDFIYPMRLGTLVNFRNEFEIPIKLGGYANASNLQIMTAQKCAETLKDTISPYLIQRLKSDVAADLPKKREQVLFCKLTKQQRTDYELFLKSGEMDAILKRTRQSLYGIDILRKICNHPDLLDPSLKHKIEYNWGDPNKSGKMQVVQALLRQWKRLGHKTLLFSQGTQMLDIIEAFVRRQDGINYLRMDGKTPIKERQTLVDRFNNDPDVDLFLLTTKVGGLGVNLTGANRVIIYDPDWNPSTDVQARERAWRLGQKKEVTIYRLMTAGTIEEKIYHRQIFKQFLTNKVLKDPKQRTSFNLSDLHDLFTLGSEDGMTETGQMFKGSQVNFKASTRPKSFITPGSDAPVVRLPEDRAQNNGEQPVKDEEPNALHGIDGVASIEDYKQQDGPEPDEEDRIMQGIFARSGVQSALEHDQIVNGKRVIQADPRMLQREADRVAATAAAHLHRSHEEARRVPIGTVTWTGEYGEAGRPSNVRRGRAGPGSAGVLAGIADRQGLSPGRSPVGSRSGTPTRPPSRPMHAKDFEKMLPPFFRSHGGKVASKLLVDHFNQYCPGTRAPKEFKIALETVATMETRGSSMRVIWALKPEYQQAPQE